MIRRDGTDYGPFPESQVRYNLELGVLNESDVALAEGHDEWVTLGQLFDDVESPPAEAVQHSIETPAAAGEPAAHPATDPAEVSSPSPAAAAPTYEEAPTESPVDPAPSNEVTPAPVEEASPAPMEEVSPEPVPPAKTPEPVPPAETPDTEAPAWSESPSPEPSPEPAGEPSTAHPAEVEANSSFAGDPVPSPISEPSPPLVEPAVAETEAPTWDRPAPLAAPERPPAETIVDAAALTAKPSAEHPPAVQARPAPTQPSSSDAKNLKKYFRGKGRILPWILIILAVPCFISVVLIPLALIFVIAAFFMLRVRSLPISDQRVDEITTQIVESFDHVARARELCGFTDYVREPILLLGFAPEDLVGENFSGNQIGKDGTYRATPWAATVLLATPEQIGIYQTGIDLVTGNRFNETFLEAFYQDVISVSIGSLTRSIDLKEELRQAQKNSGTGVFGAVFNALDEGSIKKQVRRLKARFSSHIIADLLQFDYARLYRIDLANGQKVEIMVNDGRFSGQSSGEAFLQEEDETARAVHAFRMFVREKKRGFLRSDISG